MIIDKSILSNVAMKQDREVFFLINKHHSLSLATYLLEPKYTNMAIKNPQNHFILTFRISNLKFWQIFTNKKRLVTRDFFFNFVRSKCWWDLPKTKEFNQNYTPRIDLLKTHTHTHFLSLGAPKGAEICQKTKMLIFNTWWTFLEMWNQMKTTYGELFHHTRRAPNKQTNKNNGYGSTMASSNISASINYFIFKFHVINK
jgi:hypothetical protein